MARRGYSQEKIVYVLKQAEAGIKIDEIGPTLGFLLSQPSAGSVSVGDAH